MDDELKRRKERRRLGAEKKELELKEEKVDFISNNVDNEIVNNHDEIVEESKEAPINEELQDNVEKEETVSNNIDNEIVNNTEEIIEEKKPTQEIDKDFVEVEKKKGGFFRILFRIIGVLIFLFILFETAIGIINMNQLNNDKEPVWYFSKNTTKANGKVETTYNLGLYVIVNTTQGKEKKIALKPFFLK